MRLVLIGGGNTRGGAWETEEIDREIVRMSDKEKPNFLFIGLASSFADSYYDAMKNIYRSLGCECQYLKKKNIINNRDIVENKIRNADIIYIGGGDTIKLLNEIKEYDLECLMKEAIDANKIVAGTSAGAIMLCREGYSDSLKLRGESDKYDFIEGLNYLNIIFSPHHSEEKYKEMLKDLNQREVYSLENGTALKVIDKDISIIKSNKDAKAYLITNNQKKNLN